MLNKLLQLVRRYDMLGPGDTVICAVSGGADSMALLWAMYLLRDKLGIRLGAAHFNHGLRGAESDRDENFVRQFCQDYQIPFYCAKAQVTAGKKGLEAAARDARYAFLKSLPGKIATAHTANDNAETVLMHLVRGTGLKGLGAIAPVNGQLIRPMLTVTRGEILSFLEQYHIGYVSDSSNGTDAFLRNRLRHHVMPLLEQENPRLAENLSAMAMELREDEKALSAMSQQESLNVTRLREMDPAQRGRALAAFLECSGVKEPERAHVALAESLVFSNKPSARASFPGGVTISRSYDDLLCGGGAEPFTPKVLSCPGEVTLEQIGLRIVCREVGNSPTHSGGFDVKPEGPIVVRARHAGDTMRLPGGSKSVKRLFIDRKIPAAERMNIPVIADDLGVLGVYGIGPNLDRLSQDGFGVRIYFEQV